jgi:two-component system capsular synthesis sensor histidine kinase RcsC
MEPGRPAPPLRTLASLNEDLRRERRVFALVIALLICATLAAAAFAILTRVAASLRTEEQIARLYDRALADKILDRHSALTVASLLVSLHASGVLPDKPASNGHPCRLAGSQHADPALQASCDEAADILSTNGSGPPIEIIRIGDEAAYLYQPPDDPRAPPPVDAALIHHVLARFSQARIDPAAAAKDKHVLWFSGPSIGRQTGEMFGVSIAAKESAPYAIVLTSIDLAEVYAAVRPDGRERQPPLLDDAGRLVIGAWTRPDADAINAQFAHRADGVFHWIPSYGWALRRAPPLSGFGQTLYLMPYRQQIAAMRNELVLIVAVAAALIALLLSTYRYWNYRFLGRIYGQANHALETEMLNHLLVHATPVGLCIVTRVTLEIVTANPIARNVLGLGPDDTRLPDALRREFDAHRDAHCAHVAAEPGEPVISHFSFAMARAPQDDVHLEITYAPATLDGEDVYFCSMTDITERHRAEQMLVEAKRTAEDTARSKVAFFASMSHELRTPLASLVGNIELLAMGPLAPEQHERARAMQASARGLLQIVNDVLDFSKIDVGELTLSEQWASLADLIDRIAIQHAPLAVEKALRFHVVIDRALPARLLFDPIRVAQIVNNLLSNALKFTDSGKIVLRAAWVDDRVQITVVDSGVGISDQLRQRLFRPFTQGDVNRLAQARGTGLGLSICARLARLMNGSIEVDSTVGVGTRATVVLPLRASSRGEGSAEWTLPWQRPALLALAPESQEWLAGLFDPNVSTVTIATDTDTPLDPAAHEFAIVTDEFAPANVLSWWRDPRTIVWATQDGPLVPARRSDGGVEVSVFSLAGLRGATQSVVATAREPATEDAGAPAPVPVKSAPARTVEPEGGRHAARLTVLIAEDNVLNRNLLHDQLATLGAKVIDTASGDEALAVFDRQPVDAVFTDINMPGIDGYELLGHLRARRPSLLVFAISASARPDDVAEGRARGFTDYLTKPVPLAALALALETAGAAGATATTGAVAGAAPTAVPGPAPGRAPGPAPDPAPGDESAARRGMPDVPELRDVANPPDVPHEPDVREVADAPEVPEVPDVPPRSRRPSPSRRASTCPNSPISWRSTAFPACDIGCTGSAAVFRCSASRGCSTTACNCASKRLKRAAGTTRSSSAAARSATSFSRCCR